MIRDGMNPPRVAWVSCADLPAADPDEAPTIAAMVAAGMEIQVLAWDGAAVNPDPDNPDFDSAEFDSAVLRSCWNYAFAPDAFLAWVAETDSRCRLLNPASAVRWNYHKRYLVALKDRGIPVVPTLWLEHGSSGDINNLTQQQGWQDYVIKPAVSAGSWQTRRFARDKTEEAQRFLSQSLHERDTMVQVYVPGVESPGEKSLIWIDGEYSHAVTRGPKFADDAQPVPQPAAITEEDIEAADRVLEAACADGGFSSDALLYARVDLVEIENELVLTELELIEPSLFLSECDGGLKCFVQALQERSR